MCAGCFAIAGRSHGPAIYIVKVSINMAGYIPASGHLPCICTQTPFFWRCKQGCIGSAVISNQLDHGVGQAFVNQCFLDIFEAEQLLLVCF